MNSKQFFQAIGHVLAFAQLAVFLAGDVLRTTRIHWELGYNLLIMFFLPLPRASGRDCQASKRSDLCRTNASAEHARANFPVVMVT